MSYLSPEPQGLIKVISSTADDKPVYQEWPASDEDSKPIMEFANSISNIIQKAGTVEVCFISPLLLEAPVLTAVARTWPRPAVPVIVVQHQGPLSPLLFEGLTTTIHIHLHPSTFTFLHNQEVSKPIGLHNKFQRSESSSMGTIGGFVLTSPNLFDIDAQAYVLTSGHILSPSHHDTTDAAISTDRNFSVTAPPDAYVKTVTDSLRARIASIEKEMEVIRGDDRPEAQRRFKQWSSDLFESKNKEWHWTNWTNWERSIGYVECMEFGLVENGEVQVSTSPLELVSATASSSRAISTRDAYPYSNFLKGQIMFMHCGLIGYLHPHQDPARDRYWKDHIPVTVSMDTDPSLYINGFLDIAAVKVASPSVGIRKFFPKWGNMTFGLSVLTESWATSNTVLRESWVASNISGMVNGQASIVLWNKEYLKSVEPEFDIAPGGNAYLVSREFVVFDCHDREFCKPGLSGALVYSMEKDGDSDVEKRRPLGLVSSAVKSSQHSLAFTVIVPLHRVMPRLERKLGTKLYFI